MPRLRWKKISAGVYHATSPWGLYTIDGNNAGRNRWTVTYPSGDYGMVDALAEGKAWAEQDAEEHSKRGGGHAKKKSHGMLPFDISASSRTGVADRMIVWAPTKAEAIAKFERENRGWKIAAVRQAAEIDPASYVS